MKLTTNTPNSIRYENGSIYLSNLGKLHLTDGFKGLAYSSHIWSKLVYPQFPLIESLSVSRESLTNSRLTGNEVIDLLTSSMDYTPTLDEDDNIISLTLNQGILHISYVIDDLKLSKFDLFTGLNPTPSKLVNVNSYMTNPDLDGTPEFISIPRIYRLDGTTPEIEYVPITDLKYIARYSRYSNSSNLLGYGLFRGECSDRIIEVSRAESELRFLTNITFEYEPTD